MANTDEGRGSKVLERPLAGPGKAGREPPKREYDAGGKCSAKGESDSGLDQDFPGFSSRAGSSENRPGGALA